MLILYNNKEALSRALFVHNRNFYILLMRDPIKYPLFDVSIMSIIRSHTYKIPNIIPTLTSYELCKGGDINGGWKVVQRNPSCPKMSVACEFTGGGLIWVCRH